MSRIVERITDADAYVVAVTQVVLLPCVSAEY